VGKLEENNIVFEHRSGESLGLETTLLLNIGGRPYIKIVRDGTLLDTISKQDGVWNLGEKLVYSDFDIGDLQVETKILDVDSNSLVWLGVLQEGRIISELGAIWHFDENSGDKVYDSLNKNTGELKPNEIFGPQWEENAVVNGISSLKFDGINDNVTVNGKSVSLDINENITLEAWMKVPGINILDMEQFSEAFGYYPDIIHVANDVYVVAYRNLSKLGKVKTIKISNEGVMSLNIYNNSFIFSDNKSDNCIFPRIINVVNDIYLIAYTDGKHGGYLKTIKIADNGTITQDVIDYYKFGPKEVYKPEIIKISENVCAMVFKSFALSTEKKSGFLKTMDITNDGIIEFNSSINNVIEFDTLNCDEPDIIQISGDTYAIVYTGDDNSGYLRTIEIAENGDITDQINDTLIFESNDSFEPEIIHISDMIYAIVYRDSNNTNNYNGYIKTVEIAKNGSIADQVNDSLMFENSWCKLPKVVHLKDDIYSIAFEGSKNLQDGYLLNVEIKPD